jgi:CheY-like chemotaxis protein
MSAKTILVVDDSPTIVSILGDMLKREGYRVRCAYSGADALEHLTEETPDLIILDVLMPKMNGLEVLGKIKASPETAAIHVIMLTASGKPEDVLEGKKLGAEYYITKPFKQAELIHAVERALAREKQVAA